VSIVIVASATNIGNTISAQFLGPIAGAL
jgi:hypothetical protein